MEKKNEIDPNNLTLEQQYDIEWVEVTSTNVVALCFHEYEGPVEDPGQEQPVKGELFVKLKGDKVYKYEDVFLSIYHMILGADSVGKAFNELLVRGAVKYRYQRLR